MNYILQIRKKCLLRNSSVLYEIWFAQTSKDEISTEKTA